MDIVVTVDARAVSFSNKMPSMKTLTSSTVEICCPDPGCGCSAAILIDKWADIMTLKAQGKICSVETLVAFAAEGAGAVRTGEACVICCAKDPRVYRPMRANRIINLINGGERGGRICWPEARFSNRAGKKGGCGCSAKCPSACGVVIVAIGAVYG